MPEILEVGSVDFSVGAGAKPDRDGAKPDTETEQNQTL